MHLLEPVSRPAFTQFTSTVLSKHSPSRPFFPKLYSCGSLTMHPGGPRLRLLTRECGKRVGRRRDPPRITQEASCPPCFQEPRPENGRLMRRSGRQGAGRIGRPIRVMQTRLDFKVSRLASTSEIRETGSGGEPLYTTMSATGRATSVGPTHEWHLVFRKSGGEKVSEGEKASGTIVWTLWWSAAGSERRLQTESGRRSLLPRRGPVGLTPAHAPLHLLLLDGCHRHIDAERPVRGPVDRPTGQPGPGGVVNAPTSPQPPQSPILGPARQAGAQRVSLHVATHGQEMLLGLYRERLRERALAAGGAADFSQQIRAQIVMP